MDTPNRITNTTTTLNALDWLAITLLIIWGLNWWSVAFFNVDLIAYIFWQISIAAKIIYAIVWIAAIYVLFWALSSRKV